MRFKDSRDGTEGSRTMVPRMLVVRPSFCDGTFSANDYHGRRTSTSRIFKVEKRVLINKNAIHPLRVSRTISRDVVGTMYVSMKSLPVYEPKCFTFGNVSTDRLFVTRVYRDTWCVRDFFQYLFITQSLWKLSWI